MFDNIHFFKTDVTLINKYNFNIEDSNDSETHILSSEEIAARQSAFSTLGNSEDYNVPGHTSILFPPLNTELSSDCLIMPQGFFFCEHWKGYFTKRKHYPSYMFSYTISGEGVLEYENQVYDLKEGDIFFIDCEKYQYYYTKNSVWKHVDIHFTGQYAHDLYVAYRAVNGPRYHYVQNILLIQQLEDLAAIWSTSQLYTSLLISNKISEILTSLLIMCKKDLVPQKQIDTFSFVIKYIEKHFSEPLTLDFLANFASMSKYHFSRVFKEYTGLSPIQFIIHMRVEQAKNMLMSSDLTIKEIAYATGFTDMNNFTKQFKNIEHMTPSAYRQQFEQI